MSVYLVWVRDCEACGTLIAYGEDGSTVPDNCEECGTPIGEENDER